MIGILISWENVFNSANKFFLNLERALTAAENAGYPLAIFNGGLYVNFAGTWQLIDCKIDILRQE